MSGRAVLLLLLAGLAAVSVAREPGFEEWRAIHDSLLLQPPRLRSRWLNERGLEMPGWNAPLPPSDFPDSSGLRLVGKYGRGPSVEVTGQDSLLFLSNGSEVAVFSTADPGNPALLSEVQARSVVVQAIVEDSVLYIGDYAEVSIWSIADPTSPTRLSTIPYGVGDFAVSESLLAFTRQGMFRVWSVADPADPIELGTLQDSGTVRAASGSMYVLSSDRDFVYIIDCSDPTHPQRRGSFPGYALGLDVRGNLCCAAMYWSTDEDHFRFDVLDISDPSNIRRIGQLADVGGYDIQLEGPLAFVSGFQSSGFEFTIVNIADSTNPTQVGRCATTGDNDGVWAHPQEDWAYVADRYRGMSVVDISNLSSPVYDTSLFSAGSAEDVWVDGTLMYIASNGSGLHVVDVADPACPSGLSFLDSCRRYTISQTVAAADTFAFVGFQPSWLELRSVDVSNPARPATAGGILPFNPVEDLALRDTILYAAEENRFEVVNVSRPREPELVGSCNTQDGVYFGLVVQDTLAYTVGDGFQIVNVARPASPFVVSTTAGGAAGLAVQDTFAYIPGWDSVHVYSVADPSRPRLLSAAPCGVWPWDVAVGESTLYVATSDGWGVDIYDLSNPGQPLRTGRASAPTDIRRLTFSNGHLYAACWDAGVVIYKAESTGMEEQRQHDPDTRTLHVTPNPTQGAVRLSCGTAAKASLRVFDATGKEVKHKQPAIRVRSGWVVDLSVLPAGLYFLDLRTDKEQYVVKVVKH